MRLSGNVRRIATVSLVCTALIAAGYAPALANNKNDHHKHWYSYFYDQMESLARSLSALGSRVMGRLDSLSTRVDELAATVAGQANTSLAARIDQLASDFAQLGLKLDSNVNSLNAKIDSSVAGLNASMAGFNAGLAAVNTRIDNLSADLNGKLEGLTVRVARLEDARATAGLSVVDAAGTRLGEFAGLDPNNLPLVGMSTQNHSFVLKVTDQGLHGDTTVYFSGAGCTGTAYVAPFFLVGSSSPISLAGVKKDTTVYTVYVTEANQPLNPAGFDVRSAASPDCVNLVLQGEPSSNSGPALPATVQMELPDAGPYRVN